MNQTLAFLLLVAIPFVCRYCFKVYIIKTFKDKDSELDFKNDRYIINGKKK